jgi:hypothetical protein
MHAGHLSAMTTASTIHNKLYSTNQLAARCLLRPTTFVCMLTRCSMTHTTSTHVYACSHSVDHPQGPYTGQPHTTEDVTRLGAMAHSTGCVTAVITSQTGCVAAAATSRTSTQMHQQPLRLLQQMLPEVAELSNGCPIHHPVVPSPTNRHDVAFDQLICVRVISWQSLHSAQGNYGRLRGVQHGGGGGATDSTCGCEYRQGVTAWHSERLCVPQHTSGNVRTKPTVCRRLIDHVPQGDRPCMCVYLLQLFAPVESADAAVMQRASDRLIWAGG